MLQLLLLLAEQWEAGVLCVRRSLLLLLLHLRGAGLPPREVLMRGGRGPGV